VLAAAGSRKRSTHLMTASLTIACLGTLLAFEFTAEVSHALPCTCGASLYMLSGSIQTAQASASLSVLLGSKQHVQIIPDVCYVILKQYMKG